jgi:hypothetical protein
LALFTRLYRDAQLTKHKKIIEIFSTNPTNAKGKVSSFGM